MAKDIVEAHHGSLTAGNRERAGAWFEIRLPRIDGAQAYSPRQTAGNSQADFFKIQA